VEVQKGFHYAGGTQEKRFIIHMKQHISYNHNLTSIKFRGKCLQNAIGKTFLGCHTGFHNFQMIKLKNHLLHTFP